MKQKLIFFSAEIVSKGLNFSILIFLPSLLSEEVYGDLALAWTLDLVLVELFGFGQTHYIIRFYNKAIDPKAVVSNSILIVFIVSALTLLFTIFFDINKSSVSTALLITSSALHAVINIIATQHRVSNQIISYSKLRLISSIGKFLIYLFVAFKYLYGHNISLVFYVLVSYNIVIVLFKLYGKYKFLNSTIQDFWEQYKNSISIFFHVIAGVLLVNADKLIAPYFFTLDKVGKYIFNLQVVGSSFILVNLISLWILPKAFDNENKTKYRLNRFLFLALIVTIIFNLFFHFLGIRLISVYRPEYVLSTTSYFSLYLITLLTVIQNYIYYLFLWKNKVHLEAMWTSIIALAITFSYQNWNLLALNDLFSNVLIYNILLVLGGLFLYIYVSKSALYTFISSKLNNFITKS